MDGPLHIPAKVGTSPCVSVLATSHGPLFPPTKKDTEHAQITLHCQLTRAWQHATIGAQGTVFGEESEPQNSPWLILCEQSDNGSATCA
jgi:hypothetical protein